MSDINTMDPIGFVFVNNGVKTKIHVEKLFDMLLGTYRNSTYTDEEIALAIVPTDEDLAALPTGSTDEPFMTAAKEYSAQDIVTYLDLMFNEMSKYKKYFIRILPSLVNLNRAYILSLFFIARYIRQNKGIEDAIIFIFKFLEYDHNLDIFNYSPVFNRKMFLLEHLEEIHKNEVSMAAWCFIRKSIVEKKHDNHQIDDIRRNVINDIAVPGPKIKSNFCYGNIEFIKRGLTAVANSDKNTDIDRLVSVYDDIAIPAIYKNDNDIAKFFDMFSNVKTDIIGNTNPNKYLRQYDTGLLNFKNLRQIVYCGIASATYPSAAIRTPITYDAIAYKYDWLTESADTGKIIGTYGNPSPYLKNAIHQNIIEEELLRSSLYGYLNMFVVGTATLAVSMTVANPLVFYAAMASLVVSIAKYGSIKETLMKRDKFIDNSYTSEYSPFMLVDNYAKYPYLNRILTDALTTTNITLADICTYIGEDITNIHTLSNIKKYSTITDPNIRESDMTGTLNFQNIYASAMKSAMAFYVNRNTCFPKELNEYIIDKIDSSNNGYVFRNENDWCNDSEFSLDDPNNIKITFTMDKINSPINELYDKLTLYVVNVLNNAIKNSSNSNIDPNDPKQIEKSFIDIIKMYRQYQEDLVDTDVFSKFRDENERTIEELSHNMDILDMFMSKLIEYDAFDKKTVFYRQITGSSKALRTSVSRLLVATNLESAHNAIKGAKNINDTFFGSMLSKLFLKDSKVNELISLVFKRWYATIADYDVLCGGEKVARTTTTSLGDNNTYIPSKEMKIEEIRPRYLDDIINNYAPGFYGNIRNNSSDYNDKLFFYDDEKTKPTTITGKSCVLVTSEGTFTKVLYDKFVRTAARYSATNGNNTTIDLNKIPIKVDSLTTNYATSRVFETIITDDVMRHLDIGLDVKISYDDSKKIKDICLEMTNDFKNTFIKPIVIKFSKADIPYNDGLDDNKNRHYRWQKWEEDERAGFETTMDTVFEELPETSQYHAYRKPITTVVKYFCRKMLGCYYEPGTGKLNPDYNMSKNFNMETMSSSSSENDYESGADQKFGGNQYTLFYGNITGDNAATRNSLYRSVDNTSEIYKIIVDIRKHTFLKNIILGFRNTYCDMINRDYVTLVTNSFINTCTSKTDNNYTVNSLYYLDYSGVNRDVDNMRVYENNTTNTYGESFIKKQVDRESARTYYFNLFNMESVYKLIGHLGPMMIANITGGGN